MLNRVVVEFLIGLDEPVEKPDADLRLEEDFNAAAFLIEFYCIGLLDLFLEGHSEGCSGGRA